MSLKIFIAILFTAAITVLCMQNTEAVQFQIFFWSYYAPKVAVMILLAVLGFILGLTVRIGKKHKNSKALKDSIVNKDNSIDSAKVKYNDHNTDVQGGSQDNL